LAWRKAPKGETEGVVISRVKAGQSVVYEFRDRAEPQSLNVAHVLPKPPWSKLVFHNVEHQGNKELFLYEGDSGLDDTLDFYNSYFKREGWELQVGQNGKLGPEDFYCYFKNEKKCFLQIASKDNGVFISLIVEK
ncbi:MAG: hypothetical protein HQL32_07480, partial [Planctomycetes bacterium]|nr:hypothetical protein [Planctomycetota bacterium]